MARIDRGYLDIGREFNGKPVKKFRSLYLDSWSRGHQILGGFQPLVEIERDIANIFRPYKSWGKVLKDLAQPFRGIGNGISGLVYIAATPFYLLYQLVIDNIRVARRTSKGERLKEVGKNSTRALAIAFSWGISGVSQIIRGATQLAATPLSWIKMIVRGFSTWENRGFQRLVDDRNVRRLVKQAEEVATDLAQNPAPPIEATSPLLQSEPSNDARAKKLSALNQELSSKYYKAKENRKPQGIDPKAFEGDWLKFFKTAMSARKDELAEIRNNRRARFGKGAAAA
jgi:hypothetical protein